MSAEANSLIERIKQKLDIVEEIGAVVPLKQSGKAYKGLCPFHGERTPSFYVMPERGSWHCFGCGEGGDLFTFVQKQQGLDFREALVLLAERAGIPLESGGFAGEDAVESEVARARKRLRELNEAAAIWFHHQLLQHPNAQYARTYLDSRGVSNDSMLQWRLGYAPDGDALARYLQEQGYAPQELLESGLVKEREPKNGKPGGLYDFFRNRLIFPIRDARGRTIAFGGRELGGGHPKYLNTPQTLLFDKSATLYGLDLARDGIRKSDRVIIVEGYMDALVTHQYGSRNVVACIGSAITEKHIRQIKKLTRRVTLCLDPDAAGESATLRGITVAQQAFDRVVVPVPGPAPEREGRYEGRGDGRQDREGADGRADGRAARRKSAPRGMVRFEEQVDAEITVMRLPPHEDPDEFIRRDQPGWQRAIAEALPLIEYLIEAQTADLALDTPQGKMEACRRLLPIIAEVRDRTLADDYVGRLAQKIRLDKIELRRDLHRARAQLDRAPRPAPPPPLDDEEDEMEAQPSVESPTRKYQGAAQADESGGYSASHAAPPMGGRAMPQPAGLAGELLAEQAQTDYCLGLLLEYPFTWTEVRAILAESDFTGAEARALYAAFAHALSGGDPFDLALFLTAQPAELRAAADQARARIPPGLPEDETQIAKVASDAAYRLKRTRLDAEITDLEYLLRGDATDDESADPSGGRAELRARYRQLLTQRRAIHKANRLYG